MNLGKSDCEIDIGGTGVTQPLYRTVMAKRELGLKAELSTHQSVYVQTSPMVLRFG